MNTLTAPLALFDSLEFIQKKIYLPKAFNLPYRDDYQIALQFLISYKDSEGTFNSYRREIERLLQWCKHIAHKSLKQLKREDIENFIRFCEKPLKAWIGIKKAPRFIEKEGQRLPNPEWRPFVATVSKAAYRKGENPRLSQFELSHGAIKECFAILSTFYNYLLQEEYVYMNPVALIRQKSKFIRKQQGQSKIRRLSELQWQYVIKTAEEMARPIAKRDLKNNNRADSHLIF